MEVPQETADTSPMPEEKSQVRLFISLNAKNAVREVAKRDGMTEQEVASRIYLWFVEQPEIIQQGILGHIPASLKVDIAEMVLRSWKETKGKRS